MDDDNPPDPVLTPGRRFAILKAQIRQETLLEAAQVCELLNHGAFGPMQYLQGVEDGARGCANLLRAMAKPPTQH